MSEIVFDSQLQLTSIPMCGELSVSSSVSGFNKNDATRLARPRQNSASAVMRTAFHEGIVSKVVFMMFFENFFLLVRTRSTKQTPPRKTER